jgi:hypothetical protein
VRGGPGAVLPVRSPPMVMRSARRCGLLLGVAVVSDNNNNGDNNSNPWLPAIV